jgi:hypothetical protein
MASEGSEEARRTEAFAWVLVIGLGALGLAAGLTLAPALGELFEPAPLETWPDDAVRALISPEPTELARFAIAVVAPLIAVAVLIFARTPQTGLWASRPVRFAPAAGALIVLGVLAVGWLARSEPQSFGLDPHYFGERDLAVALLVAAAILFIALRRPDASAISRLRKALLRSDRGSRKALLVTGLVAVGATAIFMLPAVYSDASLPDATPVTLLHLPFTFADFAAFGNGATPLADFASQYSNLLPWAAHAVLAAFDYSPVAFTTLMAVLSALSLLALWRALALTVRNEVGGLLLYLPVLALSLRPMMEIADERASNATLVQILPERYLLPCVLAWLCARHLRGLSPQAPMGLFAVAGLALFNNPEFGGPALLATLFALLVGTPAKVSRAAAIKLVGQLAAGVAGAAALVVAITLVRSGSLPNPELLTYYSRLFGSQGFGLQPMPILGFHLVVYITFAGALILAALRHRAGASDRALSGLLAYAGCFGLAAGIYYAGRSNAITMVALFPAWGFTLALLTCTAFRWLSDLNGAWRGALKPVGALAASVTIGFGLATTAILEIPAPWTQVARLSDDSERTSSFDLLPEAERFVAEQTEEGEAVLVLRENGHLLARGAQVRNVSLIGDPVHVISPTQLDELLEDLREADGRAVFVGDGVFTPILPGVHEALRARGYRPSGPGGPEGLTVWRFSQ